MRLVKLILILSVFWFSSCKGDKSSGGGRGAADPGGVETDVDAEEEVQKDVTVQPTAFGTLAISIEPKLGTPASTVAGARVTAENHPEIDVATDGLGSALLSGLLPGTLNIIVTSSDGVALTAAPAAYGLKLDDVRVKSGETTDLGKKVFKETGGLTGTVAFYNNPNDLDLTGSDVFVPGTSFLAKTGSDGKFSLKGLPEGRYTLRIQHTGFAPATLTDIEVVESLDTNLGTVSLSLSNGPEGSVALVADLTKQIGGKSSKIVASRIVPVVLTYDNNSALYKISDEPSFLNKEWLPVTKQTSWTFSSDGVKTLYVMYSDLNGLESSPFSESIIVDTEPPVLTGLSILRGWAETSSRDIFVDLSTSDTGSGIESVKFSNTSPTVADGIWVASAGRLDWQLTSGAGLKTVYAKVIDFAGNESNVAFDTVILGAYTLIYHDGNYANPVTLYKTQSPYKIDQDTTFASDLILEAGVRLVLNANLFVKGKFLSIGTSTDRITIERASTTPMCNVGYLNLSLGAPGSSLATQVEKTDIKYVEVTFNGGKLKDSTLDSTGCTMNGAMLHKKGSDPLMVENLTIFDLESLSVATNASSVTFKNVTGTMAGPISIGEGSSGVVFDNVALTRNFTSSGGNMMSLASSVSVTDMSLTLLGSKSRAITSSGSADVSINNVTISGVGCESAAAATGSGDLTVANATITCDQLVNSNGGSGGGTVIIDNADVTINDAAVYNLGGQSASLQITDSNLICENSSAMCDFVYKENFNTGDETSLVMNGNNITCSDSGASGCRGFVFYYQWGDSRSMTFNLDINNNYWDLGDKEPPAGIFGSIVEDVIGNAGTTKTVGDVLVYEFGDQAFMTVNYNIGAYTHAVSAFAGAGRQ